MTNLAVIGGGPAGIAAALEGAALGADVTLVTAEPIGGRANWHSLVPSKVLLTAADHLGESQHLSAYGLRGTAPEPELPALRDLIAVQAREWSQHHEELLAGRGVRILPGSATFEDAQRLRVEHEGHDPVNVPFDSAIITTGSEPIFSPQIRPDGQRILAPRLAGKLSQWPEHVIVIGGGVTGAEFTYFFNRMGCRVTWLTDLPRLLPRADDDAAEALERVMLERGVDVLKSCPVEAVGADGQGVKVKLKQGSEFSGSHAFIALGRRPDVAGLALDAAGLDWSAQGIPVNEFCRTSQPHLYAAGDVTGPPYIANRGLAQARVAVRHAMGSPTQPFAPESVLEAVYTQPQLAQVGLTESQAAAVEQQVRVYRADYREALKPRLTADRDGFVKLVAEADSGRIRGAAAFGSSAAEMLSAVSVAIAAGMTVDSLASLFPAYPTLAELNGIALRGY
jgi:pyruvate/2-oxoglutarate dehydrogenase complex dihydrolipoamide dehydrogenase (E3) component